MTTYYSALYGDGGGDPLTEADPQFRFDEADMGGVLRYKRASVTINTNYLTNENIRMLSLHSSDRIVDVLVSNSGVDVNNNRLLLRYAVQDEFAQSESNVTGNAWTGFDLDNDNTKVNQFAAGLVDEDDRGKALWELIEEDLPGTFTEDPKAAIDFIMAIVVGFVGFISGEIILEVYYVQAAGGTNT